MPPNIIIGSRTVGEGEDIFSIAEVGINHGGDPDKAKTLIDKAAWAGASAVKLQTYITEKRVPKDSPIFGILKQCELSFAMQRELIAYAAEKNILLFSTPFDDESVDFLAEANAPCFKIASFDIVNTTLLRRVAQKGRPVIVSRGMASREEIDVAVEILKEAGVPYALLHCVSAYPVPTHTALNLRTIRALSDRYHCPAGFSDHTLGIEAPSIAVAAGATIVEKHFTLSKTDEGPDHALSAEPGDFKEMVTRMRRVREMLGAEAWGTVAEEKDILQYRRST